MAALAKLTILVGAGIAGTLLTKEGSLFDSADFFYGAFKVAASSAPLALEPPQAMPATTNGSVKPITMTPESSSSSSPSLESQSPRVLRAVTVSASGLKELKEASHPLCGHFRPNVIRTSTPDAGQGTPAA